MEDLDAGVLIAACSDGSADAGITIMSVLEPLGGPGSPVKPAGYEGGQFQADRRWWGGGADRRPVDVLVIDNEPSQANRLEAALEQRRVELGLPEIVLDLTSIGALPPHLPGQISSFRFPHRNADAYLRDAMLNGTNFLNTDVGRRSSARRRTSLKRCCSGSRRRCCSASGSLTWVRSGRRPSSHAPGPARSSAWNLLPQACTGWVSRVTR